MTTRIAGFNPETRVQNAFIDYERQSHLGKKALAEMDAASRYLASNAIDSGHFDRHIAQKAGTDRGWHERAHLMDRVNQKSVAYEPNWGTGPSPTEPVVPSHMRGTGSGAALTAEDVATLRGSPGPSNRVFHAPPALLDPSQAELRRGINRGHIAGQKLYLEKADSGGVAGVLLDPASEVIKFRGSRGEDMGFRHDNPRTSKGAHPGYVKLKSVPGTYHAEMVEVVHPVERVLDSVGKSISGTTERVLSPVRDGFVDAIDEFAETVAETAARNKSKFGGRVITPLAALTTAGAVIAGHRLYRRLRESDR